jgi:hypothetical protein
MRAVWPWCGGVEWCAVAGWGCWLVLREGGYERHCNTKLSKQAPCVCAPAVCVCPPWVTWTCMRACQEEELSEEYATLVSLGCPGVEKWSSEQVKASYGAGDGFTCGLFFPNDAVIDSTAYTQCLMQAAVATGSVTLWQGCPPVVAVHDKVRHAACGDMWPPPLYYELRLCDLTTCNLSPFGFGRASALELGSACPRD